MRYSAIVILCAAVAAFLNCFIGEDIAVVRMYLVPLVLMVVIGFVVRMPISGKLLLRRVGIASAGLGVIVCMGVHPYLLQFQFRGSHTELASVAGRIAASSDLRFPLRAGSFTIRDGGTKEDGSIYLWTYLDPSGPEGFVFGYKGSGYNAWSEVRLASDCYYVCED